MTTRTLQDLGSVTIPFDEIDALIVVGLFAASSDGDAVDEEFGALVIDLGGLAVLDDLSEEEREDEVTRIVGLCDREGLRPMMGTALATLQGEARETAFALSLRVLMADGVLPEVELDYLRELKQVLELSDEQYDRLVREAAN